MISPRALAAAQTIPRRGDVDANLEDHLRLADVAAREAVQVLVFPELSLVGYEIDLADRLALAPNDPRLDPLIDAAASCRTVLVVGAPVRIGARLHIGAFILSPERTVELYTKRHLGAFGDGAKVDGTVPPAESTVFHPGELDPLVRFAGNVAAVAVCADTGRPSHPQKASDRGARTYLASMFVIPSELARETASLRAYARGHSMAVVFANYGGPSGGLAAAGASAIWCESGELVAQLDGAGAGIAVARESEGCWMGETIMLGGG